MHRKITIGYSPCPNDTFIFDALVHKKINTEGLDFNVVLEDVEALNQKAFNEDLDVTKLSFHALGFLTHKYVILTSGSALGKGCGPILVQSSDVQNLKLADARIAIPGKYTTANFLLSIAHPEAINKMEMLFSDIENAVLMGQVDAGLLIHENRFTYEQKGLKKIIDLGEYWEQTTGALIPLGGIAMKRTFPIDIQQKINRLIKKSIEFAFANLESPLSYMQQNAQEMNEEIMMQHVGLYVNEYSLDLGETGKEAINKMFSLAQQKGVIPKNVNSLFVNS
ncbi:MAG: 1,4-dihydroxy-6-naphthoate synthase [Vicingaceae bacterium]|nr:1,4-dihydroxy-6-naphthoate synthase [Vicingaceae bacterium]